MSLIRGQLEEVWSALRAAANRRGSALQAVRIRNLRGIGDLRVPFSYPVSVLAGPNRCGKSTLLGACACAYRVPGLLLFADRILGSGYRRLSIIEAGARDLLFADAATAGRPNYSEFHMSSGERAILRLSKDLSRLNGALVLIDEVEVGLHPFTQQQTMLELQRLALRRELQVIVATHSPVVLDSVPEEARLFLDRDDATAEVRLVPPYRDLLQKALYGQSRDQLSILCEDAVAEGVIHGVLDVLNPQLGMRHDDFVIGRDTGQDEFPGHVFHGQVPPGVAGTDRGLAAPPVRFFRASPTWGGRAAATRSSGGRSAVPRRSHRRRRSARCRGSGCSGVPRRGCR